MSGVSEVSCGAGVVWTCDIYTVRKFRGRAGFLTLTSVFGGVPCAHRDIALLPRRVIEILTAPGSWGWRQVCPDEFILISLGLCGVRFGLFFD